MRRQAGADDEATVRVIRPAPGGSPDVLRHLNGVSTRSDTTSPVVVTHVHRRTHFNWRGGDVGVDLRSTLFLHRELVEGTNANASALALEL